MTGMVRPAANIVAIFLALALLGLLLLVSSGGDDGVQRGLDQNLRNLRELGAGMQSEVVTADRLEVDITSRFEEIDQEFGAVAASLEQQRLKLFPAEPGALSPWRDMSFTLFNLIDSSGTERADEAAYDYQFDKLTASADTLRSRVRGFVAAERAYLEQRDQPSHPFGERPEGSTEHVIGYRYVA